MFSSWNLETAHVLNLSLDAGAMVLECWRLKSFTKIVFFFSSGKYRRTKRQGERPSAGVHLSTEIRRFCPYVGYGLRHTVSISTFARHI